MSHSGNPRHPNNPPSDYPQEPTGPITKDSLANESIARGGGFGDNDNPSVLGVKGYQSTLANEDTGGAEILHPAASGSVREKQDFRGLGSDERGSVGVRYPDAEAGRGFDGTTSDQGYRGGSKDASVSDNNTRNMYTDSSGYDSNMIRSSGIGARPYVDQAPNYTSGGVGDYADEDNTFKPKGDNLVEGGDIPPNRSTYTGDVGGPNDPGRLAEREFAKGNADMGAGSGVRDYSDTGRRGDGGNIYENLDSRERS